MVLDVGHTLRRGNALGQVRVAALSKQRNGVVRIGGLVRGGLAAIGRESLGRRDDPGSDANGAIFIDRWFRHLTALC